MPQVPAGWAAAKVAEDEKDRLEALNEEKKRRKASVKQDRLRLGLDKTSSSSEFETEEEDNANNEEQDGGEE